MTEAGLVPLIGGAQVEAKLTDATTQQKKLFDAIDGRTLGEIAPEHRHRLAGGLAHRVLARVGFEAEDAPTAQEDVGRGGPGWGYP